MFVSAGEIPENQSLDADLLIIGGGPAGLILAREMCGLGLKTVVLESGGLAFSRDVQLLNRGEVGGAPNHVPIHSRYRVYGGSTTRWGGQCVPLEPIDFEARDGIPHTGWPFDRAHLEPYYQRAAMSLGCNPLGFGAAAWEAHAGPLPPVDQSEITTSAIAFANPLDIGAALRADLEKAPNLSIVLGGTATAIETSDDMSSVIAVRYATLDGRRGTCAARKVVLATGGIENARLMLASTDRSADGVGNEHGLVGRYLIDHPYLMPGWFEPDDPAHDRGWHIIETFEAAAADQGAHAVFTLKEDIRRKENLPGCVGYFMRREAWQLGRDYVAPGGRALVHMAEVARGSLVADKDIGAHAFNLVRSSPSAVRTLAGWAGAAFASRPKAALRICLESTPNPDSRVTLGDDLDALGQRLPRIDWKVNDCDWAALHRFRHSFAASLQKSGAGRLVYDDGVDREGYPLTMKGGKHHMGTTRMHDDPRHGVVDANLRVHGMENCYILGSSAFPTGGWANPTLTIVALTLRLSDHLKEIR